MPRGTSRAVLRRRGNRMVLPIVPLSMRRSELLAEGQRSEADAGVEGGAQTFQAAETTLVGDVGHRQIRLGQQPLGPPQLDVEDLLLGRPAQQRLEALLHRALRKTAL